VIQKGISEDCFAQGIDAMLTRGRPDCGVRGRREGPRRSASDGSQRRFTVTVNMAGLQGIWCRQPRRAKAYGRLAFNDRPDRSPRETLFSLGQVIEDARRPRSLERCGLKEGFLLTMKMPSSMHKTIILNKDLTTCAPSAARRENQRLSGHRPSNGPVRGPRGPRSVSGCQASARNCARTALAVGRR